MRFQLSTFALATLATQSFAETNETLAIVPGVELVKDIYPGEISSSPLGIRVYNGKAYFAAQGEGVGTELYISDGTPEGTVLLKDINPGEGSSNPADFVGLGDKVYFRADDGEHGAELWCTDGTTDGTMLLADINEGEGRSFPSDFVVVGDKLLFEAITDDFGKELWCTDGTSEGTTLLADIREGPDGSGLSLRPESVIGGELVIFGANNGKGVSLYSSDGEKLTELVDLSDATNVAIQRRAGERVRINEIYVAADSDLWVTDGTVAGTGIVGSDLIVGGRSRISSYLLEGKTLFFGTPADGDEDGLWCTDGSAEGTSVIFGGLETPESLRGSSAIFGVSFGPPANGKIGFVTDNGAGQNLWATDGESFELLIEETVDFVWSSKANAASTVAAFLVQIGSSLFVYGTDYTAANTSPLFEFPRGTGSTVGEVIVFDDNSALFTASTDETGIELFKLVFPDFPMAPPTPAPAPTGDAPTVRGEPTTPLPPTFSRAASNPYIGVITAATIFTSVMSLM